MSKLAANTMEGQVLNGTYRLVRLLGEGGMGVVYEATHARLSGRYAVKFLRREIAEHAEAFARFRREAEITSALRHPNIVQVIDFNVAPDGSPYMVMEYLEGADLATRLERIGRLQLRWVLTLVDEVASALAAAHAHDVVHRDLKPQNIYLVKVPEQDRHFAKVVDFGISKVKAATKKLTQDSSLLGTPQYMSPEQALGQIDRIDHRTDQFALAAITYEMLSGREAFRADSLPAILYQVVHEDPPPLAVRDPGVTREIEAVIRKGLAKKADDRFASILDFSRALQGAAGVTPQPLVIDHGDLLDVDTADRTKVRAPPSTFSATAGEVTGSTMTRRKRAFMFAAGGGAIALVLGLTLLRGGPAPGPLSPPTFPHVAAIVPVPAPSKAKVAVDSSPQGAAIHMGSTILGETPQIVEFTRAEAPVELTLTKDGYAPAVVKVIPTSDKTAPVVQLLPLPLDPPRLSKSGRPSERKARSIQTPSRDVPKWKRDGLTNDL